MTRGRTDTGNETVNERVFPQEADFLRDPVWKMFGKKLTPGATDESGRLVHGFVPTRYELAIIARHYLDRICQDDYEVNIGGQVCSVGQRFCPFAGKRLATIETYLGEEELRKVLARTEEKWDTLFADARERCAAAGVDNANDLDPAQLEDLMEAAGFIAIPESELHSIDELRAIMVRKDSGDSPAPNAKN